MIKNRLKTILDIVIYLTFYVIILISLSAITLSLIEHKRLKTVIQKKNVQIKALIIACEMDWLIKQRRPDLRK